MMVLYELWLVHGWFMLAIVGQCLVHVYYAWPMNNCAGLSWFELFYHGF
jgi:hypothetical protein